MVMVAPPCHCTFASIDLISGLDMRSRLTFACLAISGMATALNTAVPSVSAATATQAYPARWVAMTGKVPARADLSVNDIFAQITPDDQYMNDNVGIGDMLQSSPLPAEDIALRGDSFYLVVNPARVPAQDVSSTGLVTFSVYVQDPDSGNWTNVEQSARIAFDDAKNQLSWVDPLAPIANSDGSDSRDSTQLQRPDLARPKPIVVGNFPEIGHLCIGGGCKGTRNVNLPFRSPVGDSTYRGGEPVEDDSGDGVIVTPVDDGSRGSCGSGGAGDVIDKTAEVTTTVGMVWPTGDDTARMTRDASASTMFTSTLGIGIKDNGSGGGFGESGSKTVENSEGFDWDPRGYKRAFTIGSKYAHDLYYGDRCPPKSPYYEKWYPLNVNADRFGENRKISMSNGFDTSGCVTFTAAGTWWRRSGTSYSNSSGVHINAIIQINLSVKRAYSTKAELNYHINAAKGDPHEICGLNGPATESNGTYDYRPYAQLPRQAQRR